MADSGENRVFAQSYDSFEEAFPDVEAIELQLEETDMVDTQKTRHYTLDTVPASESCTNSRCTQRGLRIDDLVSEMVSKDTTHKEFRKKCSGVEKKGRNNTRSCPHSFHGEIAIDYK